MVIGHAKVPGGSGYFRGYMDQVSRLLPLISVEWFLLYGSGLHI